MTVYNVGDKVRVKVGKSRIGLPIDISVPHVVEDVAQEDRVLGLRDTVTKAYRSASFSDVEPWDSGITVWTDKNGVTREYREVRRKANVGDVVKHTYSASRGEIHVVTYSDEVGIKGHTTGIPSAKTYHQNYVTLVPTDIVIHDGKRYREVKRKARVGETVLVVDTANCDFDNTVVRHKVGTVGTVEATLTDRVDVKANGESWYVVNGDYVVLEPVTVESTPTPSVTLTGSNVDDRVKALEKRVADLSDTDFQRHTSAIRQIIDLEKRVAALETKEQWTSAKTIATVSTNSAREYLGMQRISMPKQYTREEVIEMAKKDVKELRQRDYTEFDIEYKTSTDVFVKVEFIVNRQKRTVVCIARGWSSGDIYGKGIAHCAPDDCFNVYIGKAIALRRALGLDVPSYYVNAPKPTKVNVGDVLKYGSVKFTVVDGSRWPGAGECHASSEVARGSTITDDSHHFGGEKTTGGESA